MKMVRIISWLTVLVLLIVALGVPIAAFAQDEETPPAPTDNITLSTDYPTLEAVGTGSLQFNVTLGYQGSVQRVFDLKASVPSGWDVYIQPQYETGKRISSITIDSSYSVTNKVVTVVVTAPAYPTPDPGDYKIQLQATSGEVTGSIELTARITAKYDLQVVPVNQVYNTNALAGKDNIFSIQLTNQGTAPIDTITFTSTHPDGWEVKFTPDKIDTLAIADPKTVDVDIKPPAKTVAGDYMISFTTSGKPASDQKIDVRVTVQTPTIWGWVGVIIIVVVVAGLFVVFMRFGRR
jgi:uncharacterized membrane protein